MASKTCPSTSSKLYSGRFYTYWWDIWSSRKDALAEAGEIQLVKKDTDERALVKSEELLPLLTEARRTSRMVKRTGGNWGIRVLADDPATVAVEEPGVEPRFWPKIRVTWLGGVLSPSQTDIVRRSRMEAKVSTVAISQQLFHRLYRVVGRLKSPKKSYSQEIQTHVEIALTNYLDEVEKQIT